MYLYTHLLNSASIISSMISFIGLFSSDILTATRPGLQTSSGMLEAAGLKG